MFTGGSPAPGRRPRRPAPPFRPALRLEALEDRVTPASNVLLPDLQILSSYLSGWTVNPTATGGREIRFATALANGGQGAFDLRATPTIITNPDGSRSYVTMDPNTQSPTPPGGSSVADSSASSSSFAIACWRSVFFTSCCVSVEAPGELGDVRLM